MASFDLQIYPKKELVIVPDAGSIGTKRNIACNRANGVIIAHWDDDDWSHPDRLAFQVELLLSHSDYLITGFHSMKFIDEFGRWYKYHGLPHFALGTSFCYWKTFWESNLFADRDVGEDLIFIRNKKILTCDAEDLMFARIHSGNTSDKRAQMYSNQWEQLNEAEFGM